ncbi:MAG: diaminopimelate epimerase [Pseudomonadota bacterium]
MSIAFTKMHGLGNDIMIVDLIRHPRAAELLDADRIRELADRKTGIGFDQMMVIDSSPENELDAAYRVFNADGTSAQQCGNGVRCVALYLQKFHSVGTSMKLGGPGEIVACDVVNDGQVRVSMGIPTFEPSALPFDPGAQPGPVYSLDTEAGPALFSVVSVGNPHAVLQVDDLSAAPVSETGAALNQHPAFSDGVNVGFAKIEQPDRVALRVFERGAGETAACGSGACAAMVALRRRNQVLDSVQVVLPGGTLVISWRALSEPVLMTGPAALVYEGNLTL